MKNCDTPHFQKALDLYWKEEYQLLFEYCKEVTELEPDNVELWKLFGAGAGMSKNPEYAVLCYERVVSLEPDKENNMMNLITAYFHNDQAEIAIEYMYQLEERFSENMILRLKETLAQAKGHYNVEQVISYLPPTIQKMLAKVLVS
jgi:tetratricopeptide (TPR) repeat protein